MIYAEIVVERSGNEREKERKREREREAEGERKRKRERGRERKREQDGGQTQTFVYVYLLLIALSLMISPVAFVSSISRWVFIWLSVCVYLFFSILMWMRLTFMRIGSLNILNKHPHKISWCCVRMNHV